MYDVIKKMTSGISIIIACAVSTAIIVAFAKGFDIKTLGTGLYPSYASIYETLQQFTAEDKGQYKLLLSLDCLFALAHGAACAFLIIYLFDLKMLKENLSNKLALLPLGSMILDWFENTLSFIILTIHPAETVAAHVIGAVTFSKWMIVGASYTAITAGLIGFVVFTIKKKLGGAK